MRTVFDIYFFIITESDFSPDFDTSKTYIEKCISKYNYNPDRVNETHVILINVDMQEIFRGYVEGMT